ATLPAVARPAPVLPVPAAPPTALGPSMPAIAGPSGREARKRSAAPLYGAVGAGVVVVLVLGGWLALRPTTGEVQLAVVPADGLRVTIDEQPVVGDVAHLVRPSGAHQVTVERAGYKRWSERLELKAGAVEARRVVLEELARSAFTITEPAGATVTLDGT